MLILTSRNLSLESNLPVQDHNLSTALSELPLANTRGHGNIVEEAEPHGFVMLGMMSRRPDNGDGILHFSGGDSKARLNGSADRKQGRCKREFIEIDRVALVFQLDQFLVRHIYAQRQFRENEDMSMRSTVYLSCSPQKHNGPAYVPTRSHPRWHCGR